MRFTKSQDAVLDYSINWKPYLQGNEIDSADWEIATDTVQDETPITIIIVKQDKHTSTAVVEAGEIGKSYTLINTITYWKNDKELTDQRSIQIEII